VATTGLNNVAIRLTELDESTVFSSPLAKVKDR